MAVELKEFAVRRALMPRHKMKETEDYSIAGLMRKLLSYGLLNAGDLIILN
jgi:hypothetical protein